MTILQPTQLPRIMDERLSDIRRRETSLDRWSGLCLALSAFLAALLAALFLDYFITLFDTTARRAITGLAVGVGAVGLATAAIRVTLRKRSVSDLAADVDRTIPEFEERWQTVAELAANPHRAAAGAPSLIDRVVREATDRESAVDPRAVVSDRSFRRSRNLLVGLVAVHLVLFLVDPRQSFVLLRRFLSPSAPISLTQIATAGDVVAVRGEALELAATISPRPVDSATLLLRKPDGETERVTLSPQESDHSKFLHAMAAVNSPLEYRFRAGDGETPWSRIDVQNRPRLVSVDFRLSPPAYSGLPQVVHSELPASLRALEGSKLEIDFTVDQPLETFLLELGEKQSETLRPAGEPGGLRYSFRTTLKESLRLSPKLTSAHRLGERRPQSCQIQVYADRAPQVTIVTPNKELTVGPEEKVTIEFNARDDFAVTRAELVAIVGDDPQQMQEAANAAADKPEPAAPSDVPTATKQNSKAPSSPGKAAASKAPPRTRVIPIDLTAGKDKQKVRGKVELDLKQFDLAQGQQLQYMVRVYDSRNKQSEGQETAAQPSAPSAASPAKPSEQQPAPATATASKDAPSPTDNDNGKPADSKPASPPNSPATNKAATAAAAAPKSPSSPPAKQMAAATKQDQPPSAPSAQSPSASQQQPPAKPNETPSKGGQTGAPRPPDEMPRKALDVAAQSTSSSTMRIHIDKWAGSYEAQQRRKLEILIDPILKQLDRALADAILSLKPATQELAKGTELSANGRKSVTSAMTNVERAQALVTDLVRKAEGTEYAFVALQLVDIAELHVTPARTSLKEVAPGAKDNRKSVEQAEFHLARAREMLANLTKQYESVKRDLQLADDMQRIKKMYQVFVEESQAFLATAKPTLNPKSRKMAELELDEEFLKKYTELQKQWEEILAELAKALAKDPRLIQRYMSANRQSAQSARDQLTLLNFRQQEIAHRTGMLEAGASAKSPKLATQLRAAERKEFTEIAESLSNVQEDLSVWLPRDIKLDDPKVAALREQTLQLATIAGKAGRAIAGDKETEKAVNAQVEAVAALAKDVETKFDELSKDGNAALAAHANRRLTLLRGVQDRLASWSERRALIKQGELHRALEVDQHRLSEDTLGLAAKLDQLGAELAGMPEDIIELMESLKDSIRVDISVDQMNSELKLRDRDKPGAQGDQRRALAGFDKAEVLFGKLIDRAIEELDKVPVEVPDIDNAQLATVEELLARLEQEADLAERLGIPRRRTNLQQLRSWMMASQDGGGSTGQVGEQARQSAEKTKANSPRRSVAGASRRWNTLSSRLEDAIRQGRGNVPPKQYRRAIESYFETISGAEATTPEMEKP